MLFLGVQIFADDIIAMYFQAIAPRNVPKDPASNPSNFGGVWTPWLDAC